MRNRVLLAALGLLCLGPAAPVLAGSVYVPLAADRTENGVRYQTQVWITNEGIEERRFSTHFIPTGTDGTDRDGVVNQQVTVPGNGSFYLQSVTAAGQNGMLEISGAPQIVVNALMVATVEGVSNLGASIPVVSSDNLFEADAMAHVQGWMRSNALRSDFGVVNLGHEPASCSISVFRNDGSQIQSTAVISLPPLGHRQFDDALGLLGIQAVSAVRSTTSCTQPFYVYLRTYDINTGELFITLPSSKLESSILQPPGEVAPPPPPPTCGAGVHCFTKAGTFFTVRPAEPYRRETMTLPPGSYSRLRLRLDIFVSGWTQPTSGLHLAWWLANSGRHFNLYGFSGWKGPNRNEVLFRHGIGITAGDKPKFEQPMVFQPGRTYKVDYDYNPVARYLSYKILDESGNLLKEIRHVPNVNKVHIEQGETITADFSNILGANPIEPPSYGWQYKNLVIEVFP